MGIIESMQKQNTTINTKGGKYYSSTYNANLDLFCKISRYNSEKEILVTFKKALDEDETLALANLLYILDIREGKGERRIFKICFKLLCKNYPELAEKILPFIKDLGRYDYILVGMNTPIQNKVIELIKLQLEEDKNNNNPSLLAKWLPSLRTHNKNNKQAKILCKRLGMTEKEYRKLLSELRSKINIVEKNITNKENITFSTVPTKAMLKYRNCFSKKYTKEYKKYLENLTNKETKVNVTGLFAYEIISKLINFYGNVVNITEDESKLFEEMWKNQKNILKNNNSNILVVADTSGSMTYPNKLPLANSLGLAIYLAERNKGIFKDYFITFSSEPKLQKITGDNIAEKVSNIESIVASTDIDKVFTLILNALKDNKTNKNECPSHIIIISDMEFDKGVLSNNGTNFEGWKKAFKDAGYLLPTIIFWNVAAETNGIPTTIYDKNVLMVSGFSTNLLDNLLNLENYTLIDAMISTLEKYVRMLG